MNTYEISYFTINPYSFEDFKNKRFLAQINPDHIVHIRGLFAAKDPETKETEGYYAELTMSNGDIFCIREAQYKRIIHDFRPKTKTT